MKKWCLNLLLALGMLFVFGGFLLFIYAILNGHERVLKFWPCLALMLGVLVTYLSVAVFYRSFPFFLGVGLTFNAGFSVVVTSGLVSMGFTQLWPLFIIFTALALLLTCFYKHRDLRPKYYIPAIAMVLMSGLFLLFSLDVIKVPLRTFFVYFSPILLLLSGAACILFFAIQTHLQKKRGIEPVSAEESNENTED